MEVNDSEISDLEQNYTDIRDTAPKLSFSDFPLSEKTLKGLFQASYFVPTEIQREGILAGLSGRDVVGVAQTGSGKTLAFMIPVLEYLYVNKWSREVGGLAALIITPTREIAYQLFETLRNVGRYHDFSAGLIIGGKNLDIEKSRIDKFNILICTPGRILQHMDENPLFDTCSMEILVLDEADRCLDLGFEQSMGAVLKNLPSKRQTFLFSATEIPIGCINILNLRNPMFIGKHELKINTNNSIPHRLNQSYVVVKLEEKTSVVWSFIKNHLNQKIIVFLATCKQVKYIYEVFCKLRPGISLLALYGSLNQNRRIDIYNKFVKKSQGVLFATDIASRGLDFPDVNWVMQLDCPEDVTQYIHRAGRSARNKAYGENLLVLMPSEEKGMIMELKAQNINLCKIEIDQRKLSSPEAKIQAFCACNTDLKASAQRAFIAYIKSVFLMKNKNIFNACRLNFDGFAKSLGLAATPRIRFLDRRLHKNSDNISNMLQEKDSSENDDFIKIKQVNQVILNNGSKPSKLILQQKKKLTKISLAKKAIRKNVQINKKSNFSETVNDMYTANKGQHLLCCNSPRNASGLDLNFARTVLIQEDKRDKLRFKDAVKNSHKMQKKKIEVYPPRDKNVSSQTSISPEHALDKSDLVLERIESRSELKKNCKTVKNILHKTAEDIASELLHLN